MQSYIPGILLSALVLFPSYSYAEEGGIIAGSITDSQTKEPLADATVMLQGTVRGTTSDREGRFFLKDVTPGSYAVSVSLIGFQRKIITDVQVIGSQTVALEIALEPWPVQGEPVIVTASKREQSLEEVPVSVSVLGAKELAFRNTVTLDDALRYVPGVNMIQGQINIRGSTGYSRGVGTRVLLLIDGIPMLSGDTGEIIWESLPVYQIDRIEVVKGAGSALYGSSALGGVINVLTKPFPDQAETRVRVYGGLHQATKYPQWEWTGESRYFHGASLSHAERVGRWSVLVAGSRTADEGFKQNDTWRRYNGTFRVGYAMSEYESLDFLFGIMNQRRGNFFYWKDLDHALVPDDDQVNQRVESTRWNVSSGFRKHVSGEFYYTIRANAFGTRWEDNVVEALDSNGHTSSALSGGTEVQAVYKIGEQQTITAGIYGSMNTVSADTIFGHRSGYGGAVYVQEEIRIAPWFVLTAGARYDAQTLRDAESFAQVNPKAGAVYIPDERTTVRFSFGRGFRAPSVAEVFVKTEAGGLIIKPNPRLQPERSWSYEVGGSRTIGENFFVQLALFQNDVWDLIEPKFTADGVRFQNVTRARVQGLEAGLQTTWLRRALVTELSYTYVYPRDLTSQDLLKYRPRHLVHLSCRLRSEPLEFGIDYRYLSRVDRIDEEFVILGIVTQGDRRVQTSVADIRLNVDWGFAGLPLTSSFHVNNVFNYHYVELIGNIAPVRNYVMTLEANL